jgi:hypothetical protein
LPLPPRQGDRHERDTGPSDNDGKDPFETLLAIELEGRHDHRQQPKEGVEEENEEKVVLENV